MILSNILTFFDVGIFDDHLSNQLKIVFLIYPICYKKNSREAEIILITFFTRKMLTFRFGGIW